MHFSISSCDYEADIVVQLLCKPSMQMFLYVDFYYSFIKRCLLVNILLSSVFEFFLYESSNVEFLAIYK